MKNKKLLYFNRDKPQVNDLKIEMRIELDSWSPVYTDFNGKKYREKIASDAFDNEINSNAKINSYLDHKMSIEYLLASTKNNSMKVEKNNNTLLATINVDENNPLHLKVVKWIQEGVVETNSFIFSDAEFECVNYEKGAWGWLWVNLYEGKTFKYRSSVWRIL